MGAVLPLTSFLHFIKMTARSILVLLDTDMFGDWVAVPSREEFREVRDVCRKLSWKMPGANRGAGPVFPRPDDDYNHSYEPAVLRTFMRNVETLDRRDPARFYIVSNVVAMHYLAAKEDGYTVDFCHQTHLVDAFRNRVAPLKNKFDMVILSDVKDTLRHDSTGLLNLRNIDDVKQWIDWIDANVGTVANGPWKDDGNAHGFKSAYRSIYSNAAGFDLIPEVYARMDETGVTLVPYEYPSLEDLARHLREEGFPIMERKQKYKFIVKPDFGYGGQGQMELIVSRDGVVESSKPLGTEAPPFDTIEELLEGVGRDAMYVIQPYLKGVKEHEFKVIMPKGLQTRRREEQVHAILSSDSHTTLEWDEWKGDVQSVVALALRTRLFNACKAVLTALDADSKVEIFKNEDGFHTGRSVPTPSKRAYSSNRFWARVDLAWNGQTGEKTRFLLNELTDLGGAMTYNQNLEASPNIASPDLDITNQELNDCARALSDSVEGIRMYHQALVEHLTPTRAIQRAARQFRLQIMRGKF